MVALSVSSLNEQIKSLLETSFNQVLVEGELSRITFHNSGHIYFTLKDSESALSAVMFRGNASRLKFRLEEGMKVIINAAVTLYKPRGSYQINCFTIEPSGQGALALAYEQLKEKLSTQGYFAPERKKVLPKFPQKIAFITSATSAALQDMLRVANSRYRAVEIDLYDVLVQGENASFDIVNAVKVAQSKAYDVIVLARGGGSIEDLWAFNEERVADAIFHASTPIVSAVGHEIDWLISDFVADVRGATPSAAMEMILPDTNELYQLLDTLSTQYNQILNQKIYNLRQEVQHLQNSYQQHSVEKKLMQRLEELSRIKENFEQGILFRIESFKRDVVQIKASYPQAINSLINVFGQRINNLQRMMESNHPKLKSKKGFAQVSQDAKVIDIAALKKGEYFEAQSETTVITAQVIDKKEIDS